MSLDDVQPSNGCNVEQMGIVRLAKFSVRFGYHFVRTCEMSFTSHRFATRLTSIGLLLILAPAVAPVHARCSSSSFKQALEEATAVFVGTVVSVEDLELSADDRLSARVINLVRPLRVRFTVERVYRGRKTEEIEVTTKSGGFEFGYDFKVGEAYLVYAQSNNVMKSGLIVGGCGRTRPVTEAREDLGNLKNLVRIKVPKT